MSNKRLLSGSTVLLVLLFFLFYRIPVIQVSYENNHFYLKKRSFEISWIHSVEKEPWFEKYELKKGELFLVETWFKTFGAGTPYEGEIIVSDDGFTHMKQNIKMDPVEFVVSENVQSTLYTGSTKIPLYELVDHHETITIESKKIPLFGLLEGDFK